MLHFVTRKPEYLNECGAAWCSDGKHSYIEDINLIPCQPIPSPKSSRRNNLFNQNYSPSVFSLPLSYAYPQQLNNQQTSARNGPEIGCNIYKNLPVETQQLLSSDQDTMLNTVILMNKISNDLEKNRVLAVFATNDW